MLNNHEDRARDPRMHVEPWCAQNFCMGPLALGSLVPWTYHHTGTTPAHALEMVASELDLHCAIERLGERDLESFSDVAYSTLSHL